ncbi:MAG: heavy-metal-associated domain-containing protein [Clostridia bacterium]|nr:heavy-metal-associated domain-containing protein [Clostridia bacterium]
MKKTFDIEDLDCAHCAAKMEEGIRKLEGVVSVSVNFLTQKLTLEADDASFDKILKQAVKICRKIEPDCRVITK